MTSRLPGPASAGDRRSARTPLTALGDLSQPVPERPRRVVVRAPGKLNLSLGVGAVDERGYHRDRKSTRLNSSHVAISYAVFCLKKKNRTEVRDAAVGSV